MPRASRAYPATVQACARAGVADMQEGNLRAERHRNPAAQAYGRVGVMQPAATDEHMLDRSGIRCIVKAEQGLDLGVQDVAHGGAAQQTTPQGRIQIAEYS